MTHVVRILRTKLLLNPRICFRSLRFIDCASRTWVLSGSLLIYSNKSLIPLEFNSNFLYLAIHLTLEQLEYVAHDRSWESPISLLSCLSKTCSVNRYCCSIALGRRFWNSKLRFIWKLCETVASCITILQWKVFNNRLRNFTCVWNRNTKREIRLFQYIKYDGNYEIFANRQ